jgi:ATP-dependent Clp protease ATP-binding subunit ClpC
MPAVNHPAAFVKDGHQAAQRDLRAKPIDRNHRGSTTLVATQGESCVTIGIFIAGLLFGVALTLWLRRTPPTQTPRIETPAPSEASDNGATAIPDGTAAALPAPSEDATKTEQAPQETPADMLYRLRSAIENDDERIRSPEDLSRHTSFREGVALLKDVQAFPAKALLEQLETDRYSLGSMLYAALRERDDVDAADALAATPQPGMYQIRFMLDYLQSRSDAAALPGLVRHLRQWWYEQPPLRQRVRDYLQWAEHHAPGNAPLALEGLRDYELEQLVEGLQSFAMPVLEPFLTQAKAETARRREQRTLGGVGRLWTPLDADAASRIIDHPELDLQVAKVYDMLQATPAASVLVCGDHGTGKTVLVDRLFARLHADGWLLFEASAAEVLAGQSYIGELEERIRELLATLDRERALWRVQDFYDLLHKGGHSQDPSGILDLVIPALERRQLRMIGELSQAQLAQLLIARPTLRHLIKTVTLSSPSAETMRDLLERWRDARELQLGCALADTRTLDEAQRMATQYFPEQHEPGRTLRLLEETLQAAVATEPRTLPLGADALLRAISRRSGLPLDVIDDRQSLDLEQLRTFFRKRVIGQEEAVECLVDRIAMLKAGLVDGGRPIGVFMFAGPTGTGKTELAKTLGELLFGSDERLLRLDMSEFQSDDAAWRITEVSRDGSARSLVARIREQPFSVVLLDEFEKAHPRVWDLFLQVFDDGRLSDRNGNVADFRHSIIILTSNAGSTLSRSAGPGFTSTAGGYSRTVVEKALFETFRREFLNRLDRIVLFNPLDRSLMRDILHKELQRAMGRRGLRNRDWAVEWEPSAIEFLLDRGFTPDLGARPLRRAIEQHLLAPLARSIVEHRTPQGDQFLFVRSAGDRLDVEFIDPDQSAAVASDPRRSDDADAMDLPALIYAPEASAAALGALHTQLQLRQERVASPTWLRTRDADFAAMSERDFWSRADRFEVLDRIERRDRIESALEAAQRMDERLSRDGGHPSVIPRQAQLLWLLEHAIAAVEEREPQDAVIAIVASASDLKRDAAQTRLWWQQVLGMYMAWAERRNMRVESLEQDAEHGLARFAVSGFGAYRLLATEHGLHVSEQHANDADGGTRRYSVAVRVATDPPGRERPTLRIADDEPRICRRYRATPSPLVRDAVYGWRSGRLDRVLAGEFDVIRNETD